MSYQNVRVIPSPQEMMAEVPMPENLKKIKEEKDQQIRDVFEGKLDRFLVGHRALAPQAMRTPCAIMCHALQRLTRR